MSEFTREQLEERLRTGRWSKRAASNPGPTVNDLVAAMIALLDRAETAEKRMKAWGCPDEDFICYVCGRETPCMTEADLGPGDPGVPCTFDLTYPQMIEQLHHHEDRQRKAEAERDRLRAQLDSILANSDSLESGKLADANAEIARLREELLGAKVAWDMCDAVNRGLREELREAEARGPHYLRDSRLRAEGMRAAAEIARNLRPKDACTCGNYLSFRNGVPGHLPGCLVGECIEVADEIEGRAEEIDRSNLE